MYSYCMFQDVHLGIATDLLYKYMFVIHIVGMLHFLPFGWSMTLTHAHIVVGDEIKFETQNVVFLSIFVFPPKYPGNMAIIIGQAGGITSVR